MSDSLAAVEPFPRPGPSIVLAYRELLLTETGTLEQRRSIGDPGHISRAWIPDSCREPNIASELHAWLAATVDWINTQMVSDASDEILDCWASHPHLVHELAVVADQRYRAERATQSQPLSEWIHFAVPGLLARGSARALAACAGGHRDKRTL